MKVGELGTPGIALITNCIRCMDGVTWDQCGSLYYVVGELLSR